MWTNFSTMMCSSGFHQFSVGYPGTGTVLPAIVSPGVARAKGIISSHDEQRRLAVATVTCLSHAEKESAWSSMNRRPNQAVAARAATVLRALLDCLTPQLPPGMVAWSGVKGTPQHGVAILTNFPIIGTPVNGLYGGTGGYAWWTFLEMTKFVSYLSGIEDQYLTLILSLQDGAPDIGGVRRILEKCLMIDLFRKNDGLGPVRAGHKSPGPGLMKKSLDEVLSAIIISCRDFLITVTHVLITTTKQDCAQVQRAIDTFVRASEEPHKPILGIKHIRTSQECMSLELSGGIYRMVTVADLYIKVPEEEKVVITSSSSSTTCPLNRLRLS